MKPQPALTWLVPLIGALALVAAGVGLFWVDAGKPFPFTTLHGETLQMYGKGLYRNDTLQGGATFRGTDAVTLFVAIPLLAAAYLLYRRGSLRGGFLLLGALVYFLYNSTSLSLSAAYNELFLLYIVYFSTSLFGFVLGMLAVDLPALPGRISSRVPRKGIAIFLIVIGIALLPIWLVDPISALAQGKVPEVLDSYTTAVTYVLDLALISPTAVLAGVLLLRRNPLGYPLAGLMMILCSLIGLVVIGQTVVQMLDGFFLNLGQLLAFVGSFVLMSAFAIVLVIRLLRGLND